jgi:hypothetical protein
MARIEINFNIPATRFILAAPRDGAAPRFLIPERFTAKLIDATQPGDTVTLEIEVDERAVARCVGLTVHDENGPITGQTLRRIRVATLMRHALVNAASGEVTEIPGGGVSAGWPASPGDADEYERFLEGARQPRRGATLTDDHLEQVAAMYRRAIELGDPPTRTIADRMYVARATAARWVGKAREKGFLGPAMRGRGGEREETS